MILLTIDWTVNRNNGEVVVEITIRPNDHECDHRSEHSVSVCVVNP